MLKILFISDTHGFHRDLKIDEDTDMVIHSGDASNWRNPYKNLSEMLEFLHWFHQLKVKYKIFVAGNHDTSIEHKIIKMSDYPSIIYLEHESVVIEGIKIFGSPYTPTFGDWAFNRNRDKLFNYWEAIPEDTDILVTHGPPKGILDLSCDRDNKFEYCGCLSLLKKVLKIKPKYHAFGHIHDSNGIMNAGTRKISHLDTLFINASCVTDGKLCQGLTSQGVYINYK